MPNTTVEIVHAKKLSQIMTLEINSSSTILDIKKAIRAQKSYLYPDRQMLRLEATGKPLKDEDKISDLSSSANMKLYFKDLGPQVGWTTVRL
jgi:very-long-chain enoyl-CoA reductase